MSLQRVSLKCQRCLQKCFERCAGKSCAAVGADGSIPALLFAAGWTGLSRFAV